MNTGSNSHDADARRRELLDAADQVIRTQGPDATMVDIAAAAGITKPILYRHFGDKGGLYRALAERYAAPLFQELSAALADETDRQARMRVTIDVYLRFIEAEPTLYRFLMHRALREQPDMATSIANLISVVAAHIAANLAREIALTDEQQRSAQAWAHGIVGMVQLAGDWWLDTGLMTRAQLVDHLSALLWHGLENLTPENAAVHDLVQ